MLGKNQTMFVIAAAVIAMLVGIWLGNTSQQSQTRLKPPAIQGIILPAEKKLEPFNLVGAENRHFSNADIVDAWSLLFVGYTHCPDVCPTTLSVLRNVADIMHEQQLAIPRIIFISVDPERDTPDTLRQYVKYFNEDFMGVTGSSDELARLAKQLGVFYQKVPGTSGDINAADYLVDHSSSLMLINPRGHLQAYLTAPHTPMKIIESILFTKDYFDQMQD